jgi:hypothetical protein
MFIPAELVLSVFGWVQWWVDLCIGFRCQCQPFHSRSLIWAQVSRRSQPTWWKWSYSPWHQWHLQVLSQGSDLTNVTQLLVLSPPRQSIYIWLSGFQLSWDANWLHFCYQIVPTEYQYLHGETLPTNQFSVTEFFQRAKPYDRAYPGTWAWNHSVCLSQYKTKDI